jgi:hypothetical protein
MASPNKRRSTEVDDPAAAFEKMGALAKQVLAVPKKKIDRLLVTERAAKRKRR